MRPQASYFVCATPRTGSNLLCEALRNTGVAGNPEEYFWDDTLAAWYRQWGVSTFGDFLGKVFTEGSTPNGVFGVKMFVGDYLEDFVKNLRQMPEYSDQSVSVPRLMSEIFPNLRYVWISRRNKVRQAVSWWLAFQTKVWALRADHQPRAAVMVMQSVRNTDDHPTPKRMPEYNFEKIDSIVQEIIKREAAWQDYFAASGVQPFSVIYEDFVLDYEGTTRRILQHLDIDIPAGADLSRRELQKQAGPLSDEWVQRYLQEKQTGWQPTWHTVGVL
ncbi:MAG: Stf0 sulfotransferase family protein [Acidobacteria bacterium]|nr:Stf0 sulfotransferase family protein [Acidobacteriota bacterium]